MPDGNAGDSVDPGRRSFLRGRRRPAPPAIRPPWSQSEDHFTALCTRCGACSAACPEGIIQAGDGGFPEINFILGECSFCGACADACPAPLFDRSDTARPWELTAIIGETCFATRGIVCRSCQDVCPHAAIRFTLAPGGIAHAHVDAGSCTGCGACVSACPAGAIAIKSQREVADAAR
jgi:ferredoxin-type protein NapF